MRLVAVGLACCVLAAGSAATGTPASGSKNMCRPWVGRYNGKLLGSQNLLGQPEQVSVIVEPDAITVQIWGADAPSGGFLGSAVAFDCSSNRLRSTLDTGAGGEDKISLVIKRDKQLRLRLFGYQERNGPNKAEYLPPEKLEIALRKLP